MRTQTDTLRGLRNGACRNAMPQSRRPQECDDPTPEDIEAARLAVDEEARKLLKPKRRIRKGKKRQPVVGDEAIKYDPDFEEDAQ